MDNGKPMNFDLLKKSTTTRMTLEGAWSCSQPESLPVLNKIFILTVIMKCKICQLYLRGDILVVVLFDKFIPTSYFVLTTINGIKITKVIDGGNRPIMITWALWSVMVLESSLPGSVQLEIAKQKSKELFYT